MSSSSVSRMNTFADGIIQRSRDLSRFYEVRIPVSRATSDNLRPDRIRCSDILSFYKEQIAGEKDNYIHNRASVLNKDVNDVLKDVVGDVASAVNRARSTLIGDEEKATWEKFLMGYAAFHYVTPRYKLRELLCEEAIL